MAQPSGTLIHSLPHNDSGKTDIIVESILLVLGYVSVGLRLWSRRLQRAQFQWNDWMILVALLLMTTRYAVEMVIVIKCGMGLHLEEVSRVGGEEILVLMRKLVYIVDIFWVTLVTLIKLSVLHFYLKIFRQPVFVRIVYAVIGMCIAFWFGAFFATVLFCIPPQKQWLPETTEGYCGDENALYSACASTDLGIEVIVIALPMPVLWSLQLPRPKKIALTFVFGLGFVIISITAVRIKFMLELDYSDSTFSISRMALLSAAVPLLGIINASLPVMVPAFRRVFNSSALSTVLKKSTNTKESSRQFERLAEPEYPLVSLNDSRELHNPTEPNQIRVTTDWEVRLTPAPEMNPDVAGTKGIKDRNNDVKWYKRAR
ncbi:hypothetical protein AAE478_004972 [Parahypoxylon ruwenzoriense]